jgi:hypothetical protein
MSARTQDLSVGDDFIILPCADDCDQFVHMIAVNLECSPGQILERSSWRTSFMQLDDCDCSGALFFDLPARACTNLVQVATLLQVVVRVVQDSNVGEAIFTPNCPDGVLKLCWVGGHLYPYGKAREHNH